MTDDLEARCRVCGCTTGKPCPGGCASVIPDLVMLGDLCSTCAHPLLAAPLPVLNVLADVAQERRNQDKRWGEQNHPDGTSGSHAPFAQFYRRACQLAARQNRVTWRHILSEETAEAYAETDPEKLRIELVQSAAVLVAWIQDLDRRRARQTST